MRDEDTLPFSKRGWKSSDNESFAMWPIPFSERKSLYLGSYRDEASKTGSVLVSEPTGQHVLDAMMTESEKKEGIDFSPFPTDGAPSLPQKFRAYFLRHGESSNNVKSTEPTASTAMAKPLTIPKLTTEGEGHCSEMGAIMKSLSNKGQANITLGLSSGAPRTLDSFSLVFSEENLGRKVPLLVTDLFREEADPKGLNHPGSPNECRSPIPSHFTYVGNQEHKDKDPLLTSEGVSISETEGDARERTIAGMGLLGKIVQAEAKLREVRQAGTGETTSSELFEIGISGHGKVPGRLLMELMPDSFPGRRGDWPWYATIYAFDFELSAKQPTGEGLKEITDPDWGAVLTPTAIGALHLPFEVST